MSKTIEEINQKIKDKKVKVVRADEMTRIVREIGVHKAAQEVDVVTTGTFGAMCSSGVLLNFGHSDPPIRMSRIWLNDVEAYGGLAAVDTYIGATQPSESLGSRYGGAHVIEDLLQGKAVKLRAVSTGTDCYPRKEVITQVTLDDLNQAVMLNPRNGYQRYNAAVNSTPKPLYTYMGKLLPRCSLVAFSGVGELSPLMNDPEYRTSGLGTRIFIGGSRGYIIGSGTQHSPEKGFGTLMVQGDLKKMSSKFIRAATFKNYGCSLYVGIGVPIPILNEEMAGFTGIGDHEIFTDIVDYGIPRRDKPTLKQVSYAELKSGSIELNGRKVRTSCLSNNTAAGKIAEILKKWIQAGDFELTLPVERLSVHGSAKPLQEKIARQRAGEAAS